jgi:hypothetical protein
MPGYSRTRTWSLSVLWILTQPGLAGAQILSPGELSTAHASLEGLGNCTQCHQLRTPGADRDRCLSCHEPLALRIQEGRGYHGLLSDAKCGNCHKEHFGKDFRLVHFDAESFPHDSIEYTLRGQHQEAECRACHQPEWVVSEDVREFKGAAGFLGRTFLGLGTDCATCHAGEDPHGDQFSGRECSACHDERGWEKTPSFDHSQARYPLEGLHRDVDCSSCHRQESDGKGGEVMRFRPLDASDCQACHNDPHGGRMAGRCDGCHVPQGWERVRRERVEGSFDHDGTAFPLEGAHNKSACESCHFPTGSAQGLRLVFRPEDFGRSFPRPEHDACESCHWDPHEGVFGNRGCEACHSMEKWIPVQFGLALHDADSRFNLTGVHRVTPCGACHLSEERGERILQFRFPDPADCKTCHREDDPHEDSFDGAPCVLCHTTGSFLLEAFEHDQDEVRGWIESCGVCHEKGQPHGTQFPDRECGECHTTDSFRIPSFDHGMSRFPLEGAHADVGCTECHRLEEDPYQGPGGMVRYRPLDVTCAACHRGGG